MMMMMMVMMMMLMLMLMVMGADHDSPVATTAIVNDDGNSNNMRGSKR